MQVGVSLLVSDVMPIYMIIALDIIMIICFSINLKEICPRGNNKVMEIDMMRKRPGAIGFTSGFSQEHKYSTVG